LSAGMRTSEILRRFFELMEETTYLTEDGDRAYVLSIMILGLQGESLQLPELSPVWDAASRETPSD
jgi:hypothetical protein